MPPCVGVTVDGGSLVCHCSAMLTRRELASAAGGAVAAAALLPLQTAAAQTPPAQPAPSGSLVTLVTPVRVFDSRVDSPFPGHRKLQSGESVGVFISPAFGGQDVIATAAFLNVTITETEGAGYLVVYASDLTGERPVPSTSNINWWMSGLTLANLALTAVGGENAVAVRCDGGGRTHVVVDVYGYVPFTG